MRLVCKTVISPLFLDVYKGKILFSIDILIIFTHFNQEMTEDVCQKVRTNVALRLCPSSCLARSTQWTNSEIHSG